MINVSELITDPDFCQTITIIRTTASWVDGRFVQGTPETIQTIGVAHEESDDVDQVMEGDRRKGKYAFYVLNPPSLYITQDNSEGVMVSDIVQHKGKTYRILDVHDDTEYGYVKGVGEMIEER